MTSWTEILKANKGLHARDSFSELWGLKLKAARAEFPDYTITGSFPLTFNSRVAGALKNYRIHGTSEGAGVETENIAPIFSDATLGSGITFTVLSDNSVKINGSDDATIFYGTQIRLTEGTYSMKSFIPISGGLDSVRVDIRRGGPNGVTISDAIDNNNGATFTVDSTASETLYFVIRVAANYVCDNIILKPTLVTGSTIPTSFIPKGYKIPILNTSGEQQSNYDLFVGDSKLYADEYLDFDSQKVYKYVDGVLTPQDPPLPFPTISTYKGANTLSSTETLGEVTVKGRISEVQNG